uniref:Uncharacterized protein n=1 Tax=Chromera velia CCMP2878 TaxID=1169474 RepID=A0A0G4FAY0_9ALVE|eukprot:Cvel_16076.t1-p1 / transcript=Cvel_16076.t1 / gene=Cvel_16076 / organism=Chromera_velia_CCMP2878 / gene_product=hypothetical protein / transcript_product=hypothetical protein / location=Cvel_scaffold1222:9043-10140(-) / protein_length=366 / sequence_SO=supercontig / SO=protein_coding / is_pseudo=false
MSLLRESFRPATGFFGLEEPRVRWPLHARADLVVRPTGCTEDWWLPVQVKSTRGASQGFYGRPVWGFNSVRGYPGMAVVCISLEEGSHEAPRVWVFSGDSFTTGTGYLKVTPGGKHDTEESRCAFGWGTCEKNVGAVLLEMWHSAHVSNGLARLDTLRTQLSPFHLAEQAMMERCQHQLFDHVPGGLEENSETPPCPSDPYDIEIRLSGRPAMKWQRVQLKSACWISQSRNALVPSCKKTRRVTVPYDEDDFEFLLVGSPHNSTLPNVTPSERRLLSGMNAAERSRFFHFIPMAELVREEIVAVGREGQHGVRNFSLDFLPWDPPPNYSRRYSNKRASLLQWRIDTSDPFRAGQRFFEILEYGQRR